MKVCLQLSITAIINIQELGNNKEGSLTNVTVDHINMQNSLLLVNPEQPSQRPTPDETRDYRAIAIVTALGKQYEEAVNVVHDLATPVTTQTEGKA